MKKIKYGKVTVTRQEMEQEGKIRITAFIDFPVLLALKEQAAAQGLKYQTYMNQLLRQVVLDANSEDRLSAMERRLAQLERESQTPKKRASG